MTTIAERRQHSPSKPVSTYQITQATWAADASAAVAKTLANINGRVKQVEIVANETTNNITYTVAITSANSGTLFSKAAIADNGTTVTKLTDAATDVGAFWANGDLTVTCTPSGAPGNAATLDVILYME